MKKLLIILFAFLSAALLYGCSRDMNRREIDEVSFIHALCIDYSDGKYTLSALYSSGGSADSDKGGSPGKEEVTKASGKTPYEAFENLKLKNKKSVSVTNTGYFLIGDAAAKNGIGPCLDFLSRDETIKMEALVYITRDVDAAEFINKGLENKQTIHEDLKALEKKQYDLITRNDNTLANILNEMKQEYSSTLVPYLITEENTFLIQGYAVFDKMKLRDYLDIDTSSGINFIRNIIRVYPIYLGNEISLSLSYSKTKLKSELVGNKIKVIIKVDFETMLKEANTGSDIYSREGLIKLTQEQNDYIKGIIKKTADYSVNTGLDILQIARLVENQHVKQWKDLKESWTQSISDIKYEYVINSKISKSYILGILPGEWLKVCELIRSRKLCF